MLFVVCCLSLLVLVDVCCSLCVLCGLLFVVRGVFVGCLLYLWLVCCMCGLFVVSLGLLFAWHCCLLFVDCSSLFVVCSLLFVV